MSQHPLADYVEGLQRAGELVRVTVAVDPRLEIAEITHRTVRAGGPALFFEQVRGSRLPVVTNLLGSESRVCAALGVHSVMEMTGRVAGLIEPQSEGWLERLGAKTGLGRQTATRIVKSAPCQQVVRLGTDVDLSELPGLTSWPDEARPSITAGLVSSTDPDHDLDYVGYHRLDVAGKNRLAIHWLDHQAIADHFHQYHLRQEHMPVCVAIGGHPADAVAPLMMQPANTDARSWNAVLRGRPVDLVQCKTVAMTVPADADIVLEGRIDTNEPPVEMGPTGGPHGRYLPSYEARLIEITAITERVNPIMPAIVSSGPPSERDALFEAVTAMMLPLLKSWIPDLADYHVPAAAGPNSFAFVSIRKTHAGQAAKVAAAIWGLDEQMSTKILVLVDPQVDVRDCAAMMLAVGANVDPARDVFFHPALNQIRARGTGEASCGHGLAIDATRKLPGEHAPESTAPLIMSGEIEELVSGRWAEYGLPFDSDIR